MTITPENLLRHELTGLHAHVVDARDPSLVCKEGIITGETRSMVHLETRSGIVKVPKSVSVLDMRLSDETLVRVDGRLLVGRPEDRLKRPIKRRW